MTKIKFPPTLTKQKFLTEFWQKKPLVIRNALDPKELSFSPEELAGMACDDDVESRLITQTKDFFWTIQHGPFDIETFNHLPKDKWTLLVQDVDKYISDVSSIRDAFNFIPNWRIDDVMISYATKGGSVGPHLDQYDVFLIQAIGTRTWHLDASNHKNSKRIENCDLDLLADFKAGQSYFLNPGDVLYLPPNLAHWGIAEDDCTTWSVGFKSPSDKDLLGSWAEYLTSNIDVPNYYSDVDVTIQFAPAEITTESFNSIKHLLNGALNHDEDMFREWFGCFITEPKSHQEIFELDSHITLSDMVGLFDSNKIMLVWDPLAKNAIAKINTKTVAFFVYGECFKFDSEYFESLSKLSTIHEISYEIFSKLNMKTQEFIVLLYNKGYLTIDEY